MASQSKADRPVFLLVAGPNGSGKSSAYTDTDIEWVGRTVWIINPDLLTARIKASEALDQGEANRQSVERIERWLETSIQAYQSVGVETVLSTPKYRRLVKLAKTMGFSVRLIYVLLDSPEINVQRVRLRVKKGGHAVPEQKIIDRYYRSLEQMPWFLDQADEAWVFDNSGAKPTLVAEKRDGTVTIFPGASPLLIEAITKLDTD